MVVFIRRIHINVGFVGSEEIVPLDNIAKRAEITSYIQKDKGIHRS